MSSRKRNATDPVDIFLGNRLKNWAARIQPRPIVRRLILEAASEAKSAAMERDPLWITPIARRFKALSISFIDRLSSQGYPAEMLSAIGNFHPTGSRYERDIVLHSLPTGMGIYMLIA